MHVLAIILTLAWLIPIGLRIWHFMRFYQIEEYKTNRFFAWLFGNRERWFPRQASIVMLVAVIISFVLQIIEIDTPLIHWALWLGVVAFASQPPKYKETKKEFVRTPRAMRMVGGAIVLATIIIGGLSAVTIANIPTDSPQEFSSVAIIGYLGFLLAFIALPLGNGVMYPVEAQQRDRFRKAAKERLQQSGATTIGITGSYGKTSTKTYLHHILSGKFKTYPTPRSFNTEMGVSRAINEDLDPNYGYEYFIAEMGAYVPGEIERICKLTHPQMSIVTAVGSMHLERFKTIENIEKAKYEIIEGLPRDGVGFFNGDDPRVRKMETKGHPKTRILISHSDLPEARFIAQDVRHTVEGLSFTVLDRETNEAVDMQTALLGLHNVTNILLATAVANHLGMSLDDIAARVATLEPAEHRLRINRLPNGVVIIDDAYSANPIGAANALDVLKLFETDGGRRIVITPGMVELGDREDDENFRLGQRCTEAATDIVFVGVQQTRHLQHGVEATDFDPLRLKVTETFDEAREWFQTTVRAGDVVLFLNDLPDTYL